MAQSGEEQMDEGGTSEKIFFKEGSRTQEAEVLLVSLEDFIIRRFNPKSEGFLSKGVFQLKLDEVRCKVNALESSSGDANFLWICEKISLLINLCRNLEAAIQFTTQRRSADEGVGACNDTDQLLDCLQLELRQRKETVPALKPIIKRLTKCKAHYLAELTGQWYQQVRWKISDYPRTHQFTVTSGAGRTFALLAGLRNSSTVITKVIQSFTEYIVNPVVDEKCLIALTERSTAIQLEAIFIKKCEDSKDVPRNLRAVYSFMSRTLLPLLALQEDSRELGTMLNILGQKAREESPDVIDDLAASIQAELPQTANLLASYAAEAEASKEALQIVSEMEEMMLHALEPTEKAERADLPKNLKRVYIVSSWVPSLADSIIRLKHESVLLPVFSCLLRHLTALEPEALSSPFKIAVFLNNCIYLANRCSLHCPVATNSIIMLKQKGTSMFLKFARKHKMNEVSMSMPVTSALKVFSAYMASLSEIEASWKRSITFEKYSKATGLLFNSLSNSLETYIFQQKFLTENEVLHLRSLLLRAVSLAETWRRANQKPIHVSSARASQLLRLMQMTPEDISLKWKSSLEPLRAFYTAGQVASLAKARFTVGEYEKLHSVLITK